MDYEQCTKPNENVGICKNIITSILKKNTCYQGNVEKARSNSKYYIWECVGTAPILGTVYNETCTIEKSLVVDGKCDNSEVNGCVHGTPIEISKTSTENRWKCSGGNHGEDSKQCSKSIAPEESSENNEQRTENDNVIEEESSTSSTSSTSSGTTTTISRGRRSGGSSGGSSGGNYFNLSGVNLHNKEFNLTGNSSIFWLEIYAPSRNLYSVKIFDEKITDNVPSFSDANKEVYENAKVSSSNLNEADIEKATVKFVIEKDWLEKNNIDKNHVELRRDSLNGDEIDTKKAIVVKEKTSTIVYQTDFDGFGIFRILGKSEGKEKSESNDETRVNEVVEQNSELEPTTEEKKQIPREESTSTNVILFVIVFAILLVVIVIGIKIYLSKNEDK